MSLSETVGASQVSATSVAHISLVSTECIGEIAYFLDFSEISALQLCGHRLLNAKLLRGVEKLHVELSCLQTYPIHAFQYPRLRSLKVFAHTQMTYSKEQVPYLVPDLVFVPHTGHSALEVLSLQGPACFMVLQPLNSPRALHKLLPNLKELHILSGGAFDASYFHNLPPTLTSLSIQRTGPRARFPPSAIATLPRSLIALVITGTDMSMEHDSNEAPNGPFNAPPSTAEPCFPPNLTRLKIDCTALKLLLPHIPNTVERLSIGISRDTFPGKTTQILRVSALPKKNLTELSVSERDYGDIHKIIIDEPFPPMLTKLNLPYEDLDDADVDLNTVLPRSLTAFNGFDRLHSTINWPATLPLLRRCVPEKSIFRSDNLPKVWPPLAFMYLPKDVKDENIIAALPTTLQILRAPVTNSPAWLNKIAQLKNLYHLELSGEITPLPSEGFWDVMHGRLKHISVDIGACETIEDLFTDKWTSLFDFFLTATEHSVLHPNVVAELAFISSQSFSSPSEGDIPLRLPSSLKIASWSLTTPLYILLRALPGLAKLQTARLTLRTGDSTTATEDETAFEPLLKLPPSLTYLQIDAPAHLPPKCIHALPPKLRTFVISHAYKEVPKFTWTGDDFSALPSSLVYFSNAILACPDLKIPETLLKIEGSSHRYVQESKALKELQVQLAASIDVQ